MIKRFYFTQKGKRYTLRLSKREKATYIADYTKSVDPRTGAIVTEPVVHTIDTDVYPEGWKNLQGWITAGECIALPDETEIKQKRRGES